jgi:hypothetical protein
MDPRRPGRRGSAQPGRGLTTVDRPSRHRHESASSRPVGDEPAGTSSNRVSVDDGVDRLSATVAVLPRRADPQPDAAPPRGADGPDPTCGHPGTDGNVISTPTILNPPLQGKVKGPPASFPGRRLPTTCRHARPRLAACSGGSTGSRDVAHSTTAGAVPQGRRRHAARTRRGARHRRRGLPRHSRGAWRRTHRGCAGGATRHPAAAQPCPPRSLTYGSELSRIVAGSSIGGTSDFSGVWWRVGPRWVVRRRAALGSGSGASGGTRTRCV